MRERARRTTGRTTDGGVARGLRALAAGALACLAAACGSAKASVSMGTPEPKEAEPAPAEVVEPQPTSIVEIAPEIVEACNLPTPRFRSASAEVDPEGARTLRELAECFMTGPMKDKLMLIVGHTDRRGGHAYNLVLGHRRAGRVAAILFSHGMDRSRVSVSSRGEHDARGTTPEEMARDRRVEIVVGSPVPIVSAQAAARDAKQAVVGQWFSGKNGTAPADAFVGGTESDRSFPICRAPFEDGVHSGKLVGKACRVPWGGHEQEIKEYEVLVLRKNARWVASSGGRVPARAVKGGFEPGREMFVCRAQHGGGTHPGKTVESNCNIAVDGREIAKPEYEVLTVD